MLIHDCSNSKERPSHRSQFYGGTKENGVVSVLKRHCDTFGCRFTDTPSEADVLFTNDVFPKAVLELDKPMVKRMDGVYWQKELVEKNEPLNRAATIADKVVFISEFSRRSYYELYGAVLKSDCVVVNWEDPAVFSPNSYRLRVKKPEVFVATAASWLRPEKRLEDVLFIGNQVDTLWLIGQAPERVYPKNVKVLGPLERTDIAGLLRMSDAFVNLSYRDACPKVVAEAVMSGLPVLYADSGGVSEMVYSGVGVSDIAPWDFETQTPRLSPETLQRGLQRFSEGFEGLWTKARQVPSKDRFKTMLNGYFDVFQEVMDG